MSRVFTYSPESVDLIISGYKVIGWNSISAQRNTKSFTPVSGIRGKNTRIFNKDTSATVSISVARTSPVSTVFSEVVRQDSLYGTGRLQVFIRDRLGVSLIESSEAYIEGYADDVFGAEINDRVWTIHCLSTDNWNVGGNEQAQETLLETIQKQTSYFSV